jgi:hypothetical protein
MHRLRVSKILRSNELALLPSKFTLGCVIQEATQNIEELNHMLMYIDALNTAGDK